MSEVPMFTKAGPLFAWETTEAAKAPGKPKRTRRKLPPGESTGQAGFEHYLRHLGLPYVAVDEAKKAIFAGSNIGAFHFHFLVYSTDGPNHLVLVIRGVPTPKQEALLSDWQKIFGGDFIGMFVKSFPGDKGPWVFLGLGTNTCWAPYPPGIEPESNPQGANP